MQEDCYHHITFGGDQLTACHVRGVHLARFHCVTEDWHATHESESELQCTTLVMI